MRTLYRNYLKRIFDFWAAAIILAITLPIFLLIWGLLYYANDGKAFFVQTRPGKDSRLFNIIKFRTMNNKTDGNGILLGDAERLTTIGRFVRKTSLDELPQLLNVLKGDMSLIGPRPLLPEYLPMYSERQRMRHLVRPGITGLAQVKGRNFLKFSERIAYDVYYVENLSFWLDMKLVFMTVYSVLFKTSSVSEGQTIEDVDDIGLSKNLSSNHFKKQL